MHLEFRQLDRRWEHLRGRDPARQRRLLASLAEAGQQTPIVVVADASEPNRYLVIDGYKRLAALQQLGRDTVQAVVWPMGEAEALLLDRSLRFSEHETALEQGWLLAEMEQRFGYGLDELARRFDRSVSWVSRRLALVELLPEARINLEDCQRMAVAFAQHHCNTRQAGQLYAAWRGGPPVIRQRLLDEPALFFKAQRQAESKATAAPTAELLRDLEMAAAIVNRATRRLAGAVAADMDGQQREAARRQIERMEGQLRRLAGRITQEQQPHVEPSATHHDSGTECPGSEPTRDRADVGHLPSDGAQSSAIKLDRSPRDTAGRESRTLPATDPGAFQHLQGESRASP